MTTRQVRREPAAPVTHPRDMTGALEALAEVRQYTRR